MTEIETMVLSGTATHDNETVLTYSIQYPRLSDGCNRSAVSYINDYYEANAHAFLNYIKKDLAAEAISQNEERKSKDYPAIPYEASDSFTVTYNQDCTLSLYYDRYLFTGGAHGSTTRYSDTWDLNTGRLLPLEDFILSSDYQDKITGSIRSWIENYIRENPEQTVYFDNPAENLAASFRPDQFYLTPDGIAVYFQQYDLGPYSSGILQFMVRP